MTEHHGVPTLDEMEQMARAAFDGLPHEFRDLTGDIVFALQDFPDRETIAGMGLRSGYELLGLFRGVPYSVHAANLAGPEPNRIFLYRKPILNFAAHSGNELVDVVKNVLIHEIGHHFGLSDADMHAIEDAAE